MTVRALCDAGIRAALVVAAVWTAACGSDEEAPLSVAAQADAAVDDETITPRADAAPAKPAADASTGAVVDAAVDAGGPMLGCSPVSHAGAPIFDPQVLFPITAFVWSGDGVVGVWRNGQLAGYRIIDLERTGAARAPIKTLWPQESTMDYPSLAVSGDVLAIADRLMVGVNGRATCRLGLAEVRGESIVGPKRVSDVPDDETGLNEVTDCKVAALTDGFLVVWHQRTSESAPTVVLFAQSFGLDGEARGERVTLATLEGQPIPPWLSSDGMRVLIAHPMPGESRVPFTFVEGELSETVEVELESPIKSLGFAHGEYLVRTSSVLRVLDSELRLVRGPIEVGPDAEVAPLGDGYITVAREEFVVARAYDAELALSSPEVMLSQERSAIIQSLVYAPDGSSTALILLNAGELTYSQFICRSEAR